MRFIVGANLKQLPERRMAEIPDDGGLGEPEGDGTRIREVEQEARVAGQARWDELHGVVTNPTDMPAGDVPGTVPHSGRSSGRSGSPSTT